MFVLFVGYIAGTLNRDLFVCRKEAWDGPSIWTQRRAWRTTRGFLAVARSSWFTLGSRFFAGCSDDIQLGNDKRISGVNPMRIRDVAIGVPKLWPQKRVFEILIGQVPKSVSLYYDVKLGAFGITRWGLVRRPMRRYGDRIFRDLFGLDFLSLLSPGHGYAQ